MPSILERWRSFFRPAVYQISLSGDAPVQVLNYTAKKLYQTQDNLKAVVDFLANSIAQLPLKVYRRVGETDRQRDRDSKAARLLWRPNNDQTAYEFFRAMAIEYFVFGSIYVWVLPDARSDSGFQLRLIPTDWVLETKSKSNYAPDVILVKAGDGGNYIEIPRTEFVQFKTYAPGNPGSFVSPVSALRQTLQEQIEAGQFRKQLWHSSGRMNSFIVRPANVQPWDDETRKRFVDAFREGWSGDGPRAGAIPLLEDGMEIKPIQTSFKEAEWTESVKLSREAVAAAYGVNPSLVWHSDTQTYASSKDNARALYAECLGPVLQMIQQRINSFLLPMVGADENTYVEFDLAEKLKGSFEERASILQSAVGGPWMTRNEARADNNLPPIEGGDDLIVPLNVISGGQASPTDTHMDEQEPMGVQESEPSKTVLERFVKAATSVRIKAISNEAEDKKMSEALRKFYKRQANSVLPKLGAKSATWWDEERWNRELADDLEPVMQEIADAHGKEVAEAIGSEYNTEQTRNYLRTVAESQANAINKQSYSKLQLAIESDEVEPEDVFEELETVEADRTGSHFALVMAGWAAVHEAPDQAEGQGVQKIIQKEWITGPSPRMSHSLMNGEIVGIKERFSNGADWPGDFDLPPEESCNCNCSTAVIITED